MKVMQLLEAQVTKTVWGANPDKWNKLTPQFMRTKADAEALVHAYYPDGLEVKKVQVTYTKAAKNADLDKLAERFDIDWSQESYAAKLSENKKLVNALKKMGFDAYADRSVFENGEPFQIVVFDKSQVSEAV